MVQPTILGPVMVSYFTAPASNKYPQQDMMLKDVFNLITSDRYREVTRLLRNTTDEKQHKEIKATKFDYFTPSGTFSYHADAHLNVHSGLMVLDFDKMDASTLHTAMNQMLKDRSLEVVMQFVSPSGNGFKSIVSIDPEAGDNPTWFVAIEHYLKHTYGLEIDKSGKNVSRACFLPYDTGCYIAPSQLDPATDGELIKAMRGLGCTEERTPFDLQYWLNYGKPAAPKAEVKAHTTMANEWEVVRVSMKLGINMLIMLGTTMVDNYNDWILVGLAIIEVLGEEGREWYHKLSATSSKYSFAECDRKYTELMTNTQHRVQKGTFFDMAKREGIDLGELSRQARQIVNNRKDTLYTLDSLDSKCNSYSPTAHEEESTVDMGACTTICDKLRPEWLTNTTKQLMGLEKCPAHKDMMLLTTLALISGVIPNIYGCYMGKKVYSNLYLLVSALPASGKGRMDSVKKIVRPIERLIKEECRREQERYDQEYMEYLAEGGPKTGRPAPRKPAPKSLMIPGNSTATAFAQRLNDNGGKGIIMETEADTLSQAFLSEYGNYSDILRKIFHHEDVSYLRRKDNENVIVEEPRLSLVLSATPGQVVKLLPSSENGLFSRIAFYQLPPNVAWQDPFAESDTPIDDYYAQLGDRYLGVYQQLQNRGENPAKFSWTKEQQERFNTFFSHLFTEQFEMRGYPILGSVARLGLICFRLSIALTVIRMMDNPQVTIGDELVCCDGDFYSAMTIVNQLVNHTTHAYSLLPTERETMTKTHISKNSTAYRLYNALGDEFTTQELKAQGDLLGISESASKKHAAKMVDAKLVIRVKNGQYQKVK